MMSSGSQHATDEEFNNHVPPNGADVGDSVGEHVSAAGPTISGLAAQGQVVGEAPVVPVVVPRHPINKLRKYSAVIRMKGKRVRVSRIMFDTLYNACRHQGKVTLGISSMASILTYAARMPIPPYREQPTDTFRYMDGAFLKKAGLVDEIKDDAIRSRKGKSPMTSSIQAEEEAAEVASWKQVLSRVDALQQSQENLQVTVFEMGQQLHTIRKEHKSMARKWMSYFRKQNIEFTPSPPDSPEA
ncbi:hypothetical protein JCGZ_19172 [Jatropha curcas]|uniref:Uncharacterized protein n=1 Tax=Jatropha curcas TaxID=180498 RepID=A0A067LI91_JATCU|nr:hypothetical protein JCGZ_19172 [Jatropha curcas]